MRERAGDISSAGGACQSMRRFVMRLSGRNVYLEYVWVRITNGGIMDFKNITDFADGLVEKGKAALDANQNGSVEAAEVADAVVGRVKEVVDAAGQAVDSVKEGFDADGDGSVSFDEVKVVAEGVAGMASSAFGDLVNSVKGKTGAGAEAAAVVEAEVEDVADDADAVEAEVE